MGKIAINFGSFNGVVNEFSDDWSPLLCSTHVVNQATTGCMDFKRGMDEIGAVGPSLTSTFGEVEFCVQGALFC